MVTQPSEAIGSAHRRSSAASDLAGTLRRWFASVNRKTEARAPLARVSRPVTSSRSCLRLRRIPLDPAVRRNGILPKDLFHRRPPLAGHVRARNAHDIWIRVELEVLALRPVLPKSTRFSPKMSQS